MEAAHAVVGIDVSKRKLDVELLFNGKAKTKVIENSPTGHKQLIEWLGKSKAPVADMHICMEATGVYYERLALALHDARLKVSVVNPACIKGYAQTENLRNKTDAVDAGLIARYCARMAPAQWAPPPKEQRELRAWTVRLSALKDIHQQELNRLEAHEVSGMDEVAAHVREHLTWLETEIKKLERDIDDHIDRHPGLKQDAALIKSIPGVGSATAAKVLGHIGDVRRFDSAKAFAAFLGLTPRQRSSGSSVRGRTMMSRTGHEAMRTALYMPALVARRHNPLLKTFAERLRATGMARMAVIGAVMHKLSHLIYGVIRTGKPFDPAYLQKGLAVQDGI